MVESVDTLASGASGSNTVSSSLSIPTMHLSKRPLKDAKQSTRACVIFFTSSDIVPSPEAGEVSGINQVYDGTKYPKQSRAKICSASCAVSQ